MSESFIQILYEQYRTEYCGPWHTRECYPWEYDVKAHECIQLASNSNSQSWFLQQAKILQDRARYIRQLATQQVTQLAKQQVFQSPKQEQEQEQEQCNAEKNAEKIAENIAENITEKLTASSSSTVNKSTLSTIPRQGAISVFRDPAACLSDTLLFACQHTTFLALT